MSTAIKSRVFTLDGKIRKYLLSAFTIILLSGLRAQKQDTYYLYLHKHIQQNLKEKCNIRHADTLDCRFGTNEFKIYRQHLDDSVSRWALAFFPSDKPLLSPFIQNYVERELLYYLILSPKQWKRHQKVGGLQMQVKPAGSRTIKYLTDSLSGIEMKLSNGEYDLRFTDSAGLHRIRMQFPSVYGLLAGVDRPLAQKILWKRLKKLAVDTTRVNIYYRALPPENRIKDHDIYVQKGGRFIIPELNGNIYYDASNRSPVFDTLHIGPSFTNLFLTDLAENMDRTVDINMKIYGENYQVSMPLDKFLSMFNDQYVKFMGLEKVTDKQVDATFIAANTHMGFVHLIYIQAPVKSIYKSGGHFTVNFYGYIPMHNVASLLEDTKKKPSSH